MRTVVQARNKFTLRVLTQAVGSYQATEATADDNVVIRLAVNRASDGDSRSNTSEGDDLAQKGGGKRVNHGEHQ